MHFMQGCIRSRCYANRQIIYRTAVFNTEISKLKTKRAETGAPLASGIFSLAFFLRAEFSCYLPDKETFSEFATKVCTQHLVI